MKFSKFLAKHNFKMTSKNGQKPRKLAARDVGNTSLKNFSFSPLKGLVIIADHMYIHYNKPVTKGQFNSQASDEEG